MFLVIRYKNKRVLFAWYGINKFCAFPMGDITFVNGCIDNYSLLSILLLSIFTFVNITFVNIHFCDITFVM